MSLAKTLRICDKNKFLFHKETCAIENHVQLFIYHVVIYLLDLAFPGLFYIPYYKKLTSLKGFFSIKKTTFFVKSL